MWTTMNEGGMNLKKAIPFLLVAALVFAWVSSIEVKKAESEGEETAMMIEARQKLFGEEHVNAETGEIDNSKVILSWIGVSNFAAAINGKVVLLNAWIPGGNESEYVPVTTEELAAASPEAIFIGHAHYDHIDHAAEISEASGATIVGTPEHCEAVRADAGNPDGITCTEALGSNPAPGTTAKAEVIEGVDITALAHVHSAHKVPDTEDESKGIFPGKELDSGAQGDLGQLIGALGEDEGGTLMYHFQVDDFSFVWNDSAGPIKEDAPELMDVMASLPPTDVQLGAIMGLNQYTNGLRDPRMYIEALKPEVFVPTHHDNWSSPITTAGKKYEPYLTEELNRLPAESRPEVIFLSDPEDYVNPGKLTFDGK